jgi:hypothetical protein
MIDTKPNLSDGKFEQCTTDTLHLSGDTHVYGEFLIQSGGTLSILPNRGVGKVLTSDTGGTATWQVIPTVLIPITGATNGLSVTGKKIKLGGQLTGNTVVDINTKNLYLCSAINLNRSISLDQSGEQLLLSWADTGNTCNGSAASILLLSQYAGGGCSAGLLLAHSDNRVCFSAAGNYRTYHNVCGLHYTCDYSQSGVTSRWLTDKAYVDSHVSGTTVSSVTGATNLGSGNGTIYTSVSDKKIQLKTLSGGTNITLTCNGNYIGINAIISAGSITGLTDVVFTNPQNNDNLIYSGGTVINKTPFDLNGVISEGQFLGVLNGNLTGITNNFYTSAQTITAIDNKLGAYITGATNLGSGNGAIYTSVSGNKINLKTLSGGTNITITCNGNYIAVNTVGSVASFSEFTITGNSTATGFTVNHAKNKQFVGVEIVKNTSPYSTIYTGVSRPNANCVCITFDTAPLNGTQYKILIYG